MCRGHIELRHMLDTQSGRVACSMLHIYTASKLIETAIVVSVECGGIHTGLFGLHQVRLASNGCAAAKARSVTMLHRQTVPIAVQWELYINICI